MGNEGVNSQCKCGSEKKIKNCYKLSISENECETFLQENKDKWTSGVKRYLNGCAAELAVAIHMLSSNGGNCVRSQVILLMSFADFLAQLYCSFCHSFTETKTTSDKDKFNTFFRECVFTQENKSFVGSSRQKASLGTYDLYDLRSKMLHNWGMPREDIVLRDKIIEDSRYNEVIYNAKCLDLSTIELKDLLIGSTQFFIQLIETSTDIIKIKRVFLMVGKTGMSSISF